MGLQEVAAGDVIEGLLPLFFGSFAECILACISNERVERVRALFQHGPEGFHAFWGQRFASLAKDYFRVF